MDTRRASNGLPVEYRAASVPRQLSRVLPIAPRVLCKQKDRVTGFYDMMQWWLVTLVSGCSSWADLQNCCLRFFVESVTHRRDWDLPPTDSDRRMIPA